MKKMNLDCTHETFGTVRVIYDGQKLLFCANDIARGLGYSDPWSGVRNHCEKRELHEHADRHGRKKMNFISVPDVLRLAECSTYPGSRDFVQWLFTEVVPGVFEAYEKDREPFAVPDEDEEFLITFGSYMRHIEETMELFLYALALLRRIALLPSTAETADLRKMKERIEEDLIRRWKAWGMPEDFLLHGDLESIRDMIEGELIRPADAGYQDPAKAQEKEPAGDEGCGRLQPRDEGYDMMKDILESIPFFKARADR